MGTRPTVVVYLLIVGDGGAVDRVGIEGSVGLAWSGDSGVV